MLPGVIVPANGVGAMGSVTKGQRRCIKIEGNPFPIAVGKMLVNQTQMEKLKGKGLEVCHVFKDMLWEFSGKKIPNAGFTEKDDEVCPCSELSYTAAAEPSTTAAPTTPKDGDGPAEAAAASDDAAAKGEGVSGEAAAEAAEAKSSGRKAEDWSQDDLLDFCFVQGIKTVSSFPIEASELYEKHMKPSRPEGTTLDVKKSSHKQIGKFLNALRKAKVIEVNEKKGVISVTKVDVGHKSFVKLAEKFADDAAEVADSKAASAAAAEAEKAAAAKPEPKVMTVWKPGHYLEGMFKAAGKSKSDLYPWAEVKAVLEAFIKKEEAALDGTSVKLTEEIINALYRTSGGQKKDLTFPEEADMAELEEKMMDRMSEHTTISVDGLGSSTRKGPMQKIEVSLSRKGAHNVTRICNLEAYGIDVEPMGELLKKKLSCTVHIEDMPGKNVKDKMMQFQGHVAQELQEHLETEFGITKSFISVK